MSNILGFTDNRGQTETPEWLNHLWEHNTEHIIIIIVEKHTSESAKYSIRILSTCGNSTYVYEYYKILM